jgi:Fe-S cluster biosynthesis and repair protein YggX
MARVHGLPAVAPRPRAGPRHRRSRGRHTVRADAGGGLPPRQKPGRIRAMTRMVKCAKLGETLPGLPYKPFNDALGQRIYDTVSAQGWALWIEHSKKIVNEYRLDLTQKKAHEVLKEQCEAFLFGDGGTVPAEYVPEKH